MAYSRNLRDYNPDELRAVIEAYHVRGLTHSQIEQQLGIGPREKLVAMCAIADNEKLILRDVIISPLCEAEHNRLIDYGSMLVDKYGLKRCELVYGRPELLNAADPAILSTQDMQPITE